MIIREVRPEDLSDMVDVFRSCWTISYKDLLPESVRNAMDVAAATELLKGSVEKNPERKTLVVVDGEKVVGMARIGTDPNDPSRGHLFSLYIHPNAAGRGFGKALLQAAMDEISARGFTSRTLWVFTDNKVAQGLYTSRGFTPTGNEKIDPRWQIPEMEMISPK